MAENADTLNCVELKSSFDRLFEDADFHAKYDKASPELVKQAAQSFLFKTLDAGVFENLKSVVLNMVGGDAQKTKDKHLPMRSAEEIAAEKKRTKEEEDGLDPWADGDEEDTTSVTEGDKPGTIFGMHLGRKKVPVVAQPPAQKEGKELEDEIDAVKKKQEWLSLKEAASVLLEEFEAKDVLRYLAITEIHLGKKSKVDDAAFHELCLHTAVAGRRFLLLFHTHAAAIYHTAKVQIKVTSVAANLASEAIAAVTHTGAWIAAKGADAIPLPTQLVEGKHRENKIFMIDYFMNAYFKHQLTLSTEGKLKKLYDEKRVWIQEVNGIKDEVDAIGEPLKPIHIDRLHQIWNEFTGKYEPGSGAGSAL